MLEYILKATITSSFYFSKNINVGLRQLRLYFIFLHLRFSLALFIFKMEGGS